MKMVRGLLEYNARTDVGMAPNLTHLVRLMPTWQLPITETERYPHLPTGRCAQNLSLTTSPYHSSISRDIIGESTVFPRVFQHSKAEMIAPLRIREIDPLASHGSALFSLGTNYLPQWVKISEVGYLTTLHLTLRAVLV